MGEVTAGLEPYDTALAPAAFGLNNTGTICYFNSLLQVLAACTSFTRAVLAEANADYLAATLTGRAVRAYVVAYAAGADVSFESARVQGALTADLAARRPHVQFGHGQESASEALVHLLDMVEPESYSQSSYQPPITRLFTSRHRCKVFCEGCRRQVSEQADPAVTHNLFHFDAAPPDTAAAFAEALTRHTSVTENFRCEKCGPTKATRIYDLTMVPEVLICTFNLYVEYGGSRVARFFPDRLSIPSVTEGRNLVYGVVGQVEQSGSLHGGHYWARARRAGGVYTLNDMGVSPGTFAPSPNTYIVVYHYVGESGK